MGGKNSKNSLRPHFGSLYRPHVPLSLDSNSSSWKFSVKHKKVLTEFCKKPEINVPKEVVTAISSFLPQDSLAILSRHGISPPYGTHCSTYQQQYKIAIFGDIGSGKSAFTLRLTYKEFIKDYEPTKVDTYQLQVPNDKDKNRLSKVELFDTYPSEEYARLDPLWIPHQQGFIIAYDMTDINSYNNIEKYMNKIRNTRKNSHQMENIPCLLLGCKGDLILNGSEERCVEMEKVVEFCKDKNIPYIECSAKDNININVVIQTMFVEMYREIKSTKKS